MEPHSAYLHIPFCQHRCNYCDFNTYAGLDDLIPAYVRALVVEIKTLAAGLDDKLPVHTIYFGGGTPSLLSEASIEQLLQVLDDAFSLLAPVEITLEANPGTLSRPYLEGLRALGVNRLSLGMQSAHTRELAFLERIHDHLEVIDAVKWARQAGFDNLSLDLIFGLPEQTIPVWQASLDAALALAPRHFSLYALTVEQGTPLGHWYNRGLIPPPDPDLAAQMYEQASDTLAATGYVQYEISNWVSELRNDGRIVAADPKLACQHNLQYWRNQPYLGFGAGAHGFASGLRTANVLSPRAYIECFRAGTPQKSLSFPRTPATASSTVIDPQTEMRETMMMGLRLTSEGVSDQDFQARFGRSMSAVFGNEIDQLIDWDLLTLEGDTLRLTPRGRLLGNQVFMRFV